MYYFGRLALICVIMIANSSVVSTWSQTPSNLQVFPIAKPEAVHISERLNSPYILTVYLNDDPEPYKAYVDTGATNTIINERLANKFRLNLASEITYTTQTSLKPLRLNESIDDIDIRLELGKESLSVKPLVLSKEAKREDAQAAIVSAFEEIDIFIGMDFLSFTDFTLIPNQQYFQITSLGSNSSKASSHSQLKVALIVAGKEYLCALDTGTPDQDGVVFKRHHKDYEALRSYFSKWHWSYSTVSWSGWARIALDTDAEIKGLAGKGLLAYFEPRSENDETEDDYTDYLSLCTVGPKTFQSATLNWGHGQLDLTGELAPPRYDRSGLKNANYFTDTAFLAAGDLWPDM